MAEEDALYALPANVMDTTPKFLEILIGHDTKSMMDVSGMVDDTVELAQFVEKPNRSKMRFFKVLKLNPNAAKKGRAVTSGLRSDHVCVQLFDVLHVDITGFEVHVRNNIDEVADSVHVLSLTELWRLGREGLLTRWRRGQVQHNVGYIMDGLPEDLRRSPLVQRVVTKLVNSGAYPGPSLLHDATGDSPDELAVLRQLVGLQFVMEMREACFQLSDHGFACLQMLRYASDFSCALAIRDLPQLELKDRTTMELFVMLEDGGWKLRVHRGKIIPKPLALDNVVDDTMVFWVSGAKLEVNHTYLECLLSIPAICDRGSS